MMMITFLAVKKTEEEEHDVDLDFSDENKNEPILENELQELSQMANEEKEYLEKMKASVSQYEDLKKQVLSKALLSRIKTTPLMCYGGGSITG